MEDLAVRINEALAKEEYRAELFASYVRLVLLVVLTTVALVNAPSLTFVANVFNFSALAIGYAYGLIVFMRVRSRGYNPVMKYITSCVDIALVFLLLFLYTKIEIPSVALKNYVYLVVFPLIALTAFRYDRMLTMVSGGLAIVLYLGLVLYLWMAGLVILTPGGYERELFTSEVTYIGQATKILILGVYVFLVSHLARYSRTLFAKLVSDELSMREQQEQTESELTLAAQVQAQFLPRSLPAVAGLEMYGVVQEGRFVGGDYYDFIKLAEDRLLVVSADVSGKGVPAALIMAEVRGSTQLLASMQLGLEDFLQRLNSMVHQSTEKKSFVTFFAAEINATTGRLTYVSAGHPPPLVYLQGTVRSLVKGTIPLGICPELPQLTPHVEEFPAGSMLVSYTDGLVEQRDTHGDDYGEERLREYVRTKGNLDPQLFTLGLLEEVKEFGGGKPPDDDMSIAVVKHRP